MAGMYYEEFRVGMAFEHAIRRTVTEMDNLLYSALTHNPQPLHIDEEFCKGTEYGTRIVNSLFTLGLIIGITVTDTTLGTTIGNLGMTDIRFRNPVFIGDTIRVITGIRDLRESRSRPDAGIVHFEHTGFNQRGLEVAYCLRAGLMRKRPA
jgi:acyl dehydratase